MSDNLPNPHLIFIIKFLEIIVYMSIFIPSVPTTLVKLFY